MIEDARRKVKKALKLKGVFIDPPVQKLAGGVQRAQKGVVFLIKGFEGATPRPV